MVPVWTAACAWGLKKEQPLTACAEGSIGDFISFL